MKNYWSSKEVVGEAPKNDSNSKEPSFIETVQNRIYFYSEIDRDKVLQLNRNIRQLSNELPNKQKELSINEQINIFLHINSYGGSVFAGLSAMDEILNSNVPITTIIDGCCASVATFISVSGKRRCMNKHSFVMIHQLSSFFWGTYQNILDEKENLDKLMLLIKEIYCKYTKVPTDKLDEILKHDLWFDAEKCLEYGIVDKII